jgi:hypothetical protein
MDTKTNLINHSISIQTIITKGGNNYGLQEEAEKKQEKNQKVIITTHKREAVHLRPLSFFSPLDITSITTYNQ